MKCPYCSQEHPEGTKFCPETGNKMPVPKRCQWAECPGDHRILPDEARYCPDCGRPLGGAEVITVGSVTFKMVHVAVGSVSFKMVHVAAGTFTMGATPEQQNPDSDEKPAHRVTLTDDYYMGETEVTQALWREVMGSEPTYDGGWTSEYGRGDSYPAYRVSWDDCQEFIRRLNQRTGRQFRLPTEAEWEFAARGGNKSRGYQYSGSNNLDDVAWYGGNSGAKTHPVKTKRPNELGLYDMSGNVWEWCQDWYDDYSSASHSPNSASYRVRRGGCWGYDVWGCRVAIRGFSTPVVHNDTLGLRLALSE